MIGESYWYGNECEGRLFGLFTLFVRYSIPDKIKDKAVHIYFTREFLKKKNAVEKIEKFIKSNYVVTVETNKKTYRTLTPNIKVHCHIIYRIEDDVPFDLKQTDSIFIDKDTYNVLCFTKYQALLISPVDYSKDIFK